MLQDFETILTPRRQAHIYATGATTILVLGSCALFALCLVALWAVVELASLLLQSVLECLTTLATTFTSADPFVRVVLFIIIGGAAYLLVRRFLRRETR